MSELHWVALATKTRAGGAALRQLLRRYASIEAIFEASYQDLLRIPGIGPRTAASIANVDMDAAAAALSRCSYHNIHIVTFEDTDRYPSNLLLIPDAPPVLFTQGTLQPLDWRAVGIVGTRWPGSAGAEFARLAAYELAARGWAVVSGLALGIDAAAHQGALEAHEGRTLAVLGCGLLNLYPPQNSQLARDIQGAGAILSELPPDAGVSARRLLARNRITSGLSRAIIVVEAGEDSGSLATARRARKQGRAVYAVSGGDVGCEALIAQGALPIEPQTVDWDALSAQIAALPVQPPPDEPAQMPLF
ncbi:MAG: DNA-protecting protein DprA [Chloroflexi bacterium]|nr:DNA-protecting protein DprA [Chloroflexota bacterium]